MTTNMLDGLDRMKEKKKDFMKYTFFFTLFMQLARK